jgi:protein TonB
MARQWQTVLVSVVAHVAALFLLVVVPLLAFEGFPDLRTAVEYVPVELNIPEMPRPSQPAPTTPTATPAVMTSLVPTAAPDTIGPEREPPLPSVSNTLGVPGAVFDPAALPGRIASDVGVAPLPSQKPAAPIRPGGNVKPPDRISYVKPDYPPIAVSARVSGSVIIEAIIGTDGVVRDARVLRSIPLLDDAALRAVRQWRYTPTTLNGVPVAVIMTVTVTFTLGLNF